MTDVPSTEDENTDSRLFLRIGAMEIANRSLLAIVVKELLASKNLDKDSFLQSISALLDTLSQSDKNKTELDSMIAQSLLSFARIFKDENNG